MKRIYHPYWLWEDYKAGFYSNYSKNEINDLNESVRFVFSSAEITEKWMSCVIDQWDVSCEHNLTNLSMNRIAWLGQAACCFYGGVPSKATMFLWKFLDEKTQRRSDKIANKLIKEWEQRRKSMSISGNGRQGVTAMEFQMKLPLNWKEWESFQVTD